MFIFHNERATVSAHGYLFGDDENLVIVPDNTDRLAEDMLA